MPQKKSYFALQLPKGWWVFGLDLALHGDIDVDQFKFFAELVKEKVTFFISYSRLYSGFVFSDYSIFLKFKYFSSIRLRRMMQ